MLRLPALRLCPVCAPLLQAGGSGWVGLGLALALAASEVVETLTVNW